MAIFYSWPLPGEGITAEELLMAEIRTALAGVNTYSGQARRDAVLAEIVRALFNSQALAALVVTDFRPSRLGTPAVLLTSIGGGAVAVDVSAGTYFSITVNSTGAYTISNPTGLYGSGTVQQPVVVEVHNNSGGAITTTFAANWHLAGAWVDPGNGKSRFATFLQLNTVFQEISRSVADT
jgi:hypothetical protein